MKRTFDNLMNTFKKRKTTETTSQDIHAPSDSDYLTSPKKESNSMMPKFNITNRNFKWKSKPTVQENKKQPETIQQEAFMSPQVKRHNSTLFSPPKTNLFDPFNLFSPRNKENNPGFPTIQAPSFGSDYDFMSPSKEKPFEFTMKEYIPEEPLFYFQNQMVELAEAPKEIQSYTGKRKFEESTIMTKVESLPSTIKFSLISARNLIATEKGFKEKSDPFICVEYGLQKYNSKVCNATTDPQFNQTFSIFVDIQPSSLILKMNVYDHDDVFDPECIGNAEINIQEAYYQSKSRHGKSDEVSCWVPIKNGTGEIFVVYRILEGYDVKIV